MTRDDKGRFKKGHEGVGGRPKRETEQAYLEAFKSTVKAEDWIAIIQRAVDDAKTGDKDARKFIADYLIGPPVQKQEIEGKVQVIWKSHRPQTG